jgi:hypothetical protein
VRKSGDFPFGVRASKVRSVKVTLLFLGSGSPAVVERRTPRAFERPYASS